MFLKARDSAVHLLKLFRVLEVVGAAIRRVEALKVEIATPLAWSLTIALDLATLALIAVNRER